MFTGGGWLVAHYPRVQCAYFGPEVDDPSFDAYLDRLQTDIDDRAGRRVGVLYYAPQTTAMDSPRRRRLAALLDANKETLGRSTAAYALATHSPFVRGLLTTLFWMAPPPYPYKIVATPTEGMAFLGEHLPGLDEATHTSSFEKLLAHAELRRSG